MIPDYARSLNKRTVKLHFYTHMEREWIQAVNEKPQPRECGRIQSRRAQMHESHRDSLGCLDGKK